MANSSRTRIRGPEFPGERTEGQAHRSPEREGFSRAARAAHLGAVPRARCLPESFLPLTVVVFEILLAPGS